jgi:hypothetical protein
VSDTKWTAEDGTTVTLDQLLSDIEHVPVKKIDVQRLRHKLLDWNNDPHEWKRVKTVDTSYPPIIVMSGLTVDIIIDGNHRIQKLIQLGYKEIDAKLISLNELPEVYKKIV